MRNNQNGGWKWFGLMTYLQNWIAWNITVFDIESVLTLNWIVWKRTVFDIETVLMQNWIVFKK